MDQRNFAQAEKDLARALSLSPRSDSARYEHAYLALLQGDVRACVAEIEPMAKEATASERVFHLWGSALDMLGESERAKRAFAGGLERFEKSALLRHGLGVLAAKEGDPLSAVTAWEQGIWHDPTFAANWFASGRLYAGTEERARVVLYMETLRNLEPASARSIEAATYMMKAFGSALRPVDGGTEVVFTGRAPVVSPEGMAVHFENVFELTMIKALVREPSGMEDLATIASVHRARVRFTGLSERTAAAAWPHPLTEWHRRLAKTPHFEAYDYWLLGPARPKEFEAWHSTHSKDFTAFERWIATNRPIPAAFDSKTRVLKP